MHPPPPPPRRPPRRPLTPLPAPRRLSGAFCERRGHHRRGQLGRPLLCTHCRCRPPRSRRPLPRSVSSSRSTAAPRLSIAVTSATTMTSASAIARPPPPAAWVRHPSAGHPRPSGRLSPLYPCSFDHDQDAHPTPSRDHRPGPGWNRRSVLRSRGRSCRVRLPARPSSLGLEADYAALSHPSCSSLSVDRGSRGGSPRASTAPRVRVGRGLSRPRGVPGRRPRTSRGAWRARCGPATPQR